MAEESISKQYNPTQVENHWYGEWEKAGVFEADATASQPNFVLMMPPPNVTGVLHIGHALTMTLEDILVRRKRMQGHNALWVPGTDHAGIATQMVVERRVKKEEKKSRHDLGREAFLERVWDWKEQSQGTILKQLRDIGSSCDWSRLRFTLDDSLCRAVRECFVRLYEDRLIFKDKAMTHWCPRCRTVISDLEVKFNSTKGKLCYIRYLLKGDAKRWLTVATTRPETLLGDTAVAIHPEDERFKAFHGQSVVVPLVGREVPVVTDDYVEREFGTGALKITPAHDTNDFEIGKKYGLDRIAILDEAGKMNEKAGPYQGLTREDARKRVLADLESQGLLEKVEDYKHNVSHCDRCATVVEPWLSTQWFVNAEELAKPAIEAVESKKIQIIPEEWEKTYFEWMRNIRPWCISRQLWWGHRIPAWYCQQCQAILVEREDPTQCKECQSKDLKQDPDVLDTWFSSGLWPISTLGWPDAESADLKKFYPTDVMETGFDILFFWVARMVMLCHRMTGQFPFHTIYLHPMVRDEYGQKMSKTKGNVKDPLEIIHKTGADALRFTLAAMAVHGRDLSLSDSRIEGYRNFVNKIWNASRFILMHFSDVKEENRDATNPINRWIEARLSKTTHQVNKAFDEYRFFDAANYIYHFIWSEYCDWFIEFIKSPEELERRKQQKDSTAIQVLEDALKLLHPIMPFVTEELWHKLPLKENKPYLAQATYPRAMDASQETTDTEVQVGRIIEIIDAIRSKRGENELAPDAEIDVTLHAQKETIDSVQPFTDLIQKGVRAKALILSSGTQAQTKDNVVIPLEDVEVSIPRDQMVDLEKEIDRTKKDLGQASGELQRASAKLSNDKFTKQAPDDVVQGVRDRKQVLEKKVARLQEYLKELSG